MKTIKVKKSNTFEKLISYSLSLKNYLVEKPDLNTKFIDLIIYSLHCLQPYMIVKCKKYKTFNWNNLIKLYDNTQKEAESLYKEVKVALVFKLNDQPVLVLVKCELGYVIAEFKTIFGTDVAKTYSV